MMSLTSLKYKIHTILMTAGVPGLNSNSWYGSCCLCNTEMVKQYIYTVNYIKYRKRKDMHMCCEFLTWIHYCTILISSRRIYSYVSYRYFHALDMGSY